MMSNNVPIIELLQILLAAIGAGFSFHGWLSARQDNHENALDGINGSIGLAARWRVDRERERLTKQMLILISGILVVSWRIRNADVPLLEVYLTRNLTLLGLSALLMYDTIKDKMKRKEMTALVREEHRRVLTGGRRATDKSIARMEAIVRVEPTVRVETITKDPVTPPAEETKESDK